MFSMWKENPPCFGVPKELQEVIDERFCNPLNNKPILATLNFILKVTKDIITREYNSEDKDCNEWSGIDYCNRAKAKKAKHREGMKKEETEALRQKDKVVEKSLCPIPENNQEKEEIIAMSTILEPEDLFVNPIKDFSEEILAETNEMDSFEDLEKDKSTEEKGEMIKLINLVETNNAVAQEKEAMDLEIDLTKPAVTKVIYTNNDLDETR
ncbi:18585_t:CDS:2 [Gigaspora margarita]|uniref:18585_t:CDS:1 n=1 Tax=Gigaspora margarita TaxID=4874 RepID=A0ABN7V3Z9_GIGMA|nr:18585_t:CDS:2 [Gigaspora margarita]